MTEEKKEQPLLVWDTHEIARDRAEYLMEEYPEDYPNRDTAFEAACLESDTYECEWDGLLDCLSALMEERNPDGHWYAEMHNFGWRGVNGHKLFTAEDGKEFLQEILPKTDCTFKVFAYGEDGLKINNAHHDSPVWHEWYYASPAAFCDHCGELMAEAALATDNGTFCADCAELEDEAA